MNYYGKVYVKKDGVWHNVNNFDANQLRESLEWGDLQDYQTYDYEEEFKDVRYKYMFTPDKLNLYWTSLNKKYLELKREIKDLKDTKKRTPSLKIYNEVDSRLSEITTGESAEYNSLYLEKNIIDYFMMLLDFFKDDCFNREIKVEGSENNNNEVYYCCDDVLLLVDCM